MYIDKLDNTEKKCNNTFHSTIKMKLVDVKSKAYIDFKKENNEEDPKFEVGDSVRTLKYKSIFAKC